LWGAPPPTPPVDQWLITYVSHCCPKTLYGVKKINKKKHCWVQQWTLHWVAGWSPSAWMPISGRTDVGRTYGLRDIQCGGDNLQVPIIFGRRQAKKSNFRCSKQRKHADIRSVGFTSGMGVSSLPVSESSAGQKYNSKNVVFRLYFHIILSLVHTFGLW
jgi:hypothetical protein